MAGEIDCQSWGIEAALRFRAEVLNASIVWLDPKSDNLARWNFIRWDDGAFDRPLAFAEEFTLLSRRSTSPAYITIASTASLLARRIVAGKFVIDSNHTEA